MPPTTSALAAGTVATGTAAEAGGATNLQLRRNIYETSSTVLTDKERAAITTQHTHITCSTCQADCTTVRYHCVKTKDLDVCPGCYLEGRFSSALNSGDFVKVNSSLLQRTEEEEWAEEEKLLLLEGIEMFDDDWYKVAQHVGTRSREQCILKFLQLPIEDDYLEANIGALGPLQYRQIPFSQADNPVMSVVAFLASVVNPGVASAAAKAALHELTATVAPVAEKKATLSPGKAPHSPGKATDGKRSRSPSPKRDAPPSSTAPSAATLEKAAAAALGAAAAKAKTLADYEEREIQRLVHATIEAQMRKIELKMNQFEELESIIDKERQELERQRQQLYVERLALHKAIVGMQQGGDGSVSALKAVAVGELPGPDDVEMAEGATITKL